MLDIFLALDILLRIIAISVISFLAGHAAIQFIGMVFHDCDK